MKTLILLISRSSTTLKIILNKSYVIFVFINLFYMYECIACMCINASMLYNAHGDKKKVSDTPELVVSCHVCAGNGT